MDAASAVVTVPASSTTVLTTTKPTPSNAINVNQSNNHIHKHTITHSGTNSLSATTNSSNSNISIGVNSSNSNSSCSSSSTSSNSSGYGSTTTTPTNNYDLHQQTTPTTTPAPTTPVAIAEPIIPVATVAAVTPFYNESITAHNLETRQLQPHSHHTQQQQLHQNQHQLLQPNYPHQLPQNHLQTNLQPQQHHPQYLSRQQYYSTYDYQQPAITHNLSGSSALPAATAYNVGITGPYELNSPSYGSGQYKSSCLTGAINYERAGIRTNAVATSYNQQQHQQQNEQQQSKPINQQTQQFPAVLASSKQRTSSLIGNSTSTNTSKPQAAATPFYAQPLLSQSHSNPTPFYDNTKYKMPLEYHDSYSNSTAAATATYHQQQKYYAAAKSQLKEAGYGASPGFNSKSVYPNTANFFPGPSGNPGLSTNPYDKYMYPHSSATGYSATGHLGNETPPEVSNYRKPVVANSINSPSWPWGIDYPSGNSRTIPPPASHLPTATVAPTHATYLQPNPTTLTRDPYYMGHDKYAVKYDKYAAPSYQQSYVSPPASRHHLWPSTPHASNLTQLNERHLLATGPTATSSHGLHATPYFPSNSTSGLNSRQSCCSQPYQPQSCYYPSSHAIPPRLPHNQSASVATASSSYLPSQQTLGQSPHLNALSASCKYGGVIPDYGNGNKIKHSNDLYLNAHHYDNNTSPHNYGYGSAHSSQQLYASNAHQSMAHGLTPSSLLTHDPLNANPAPYTNDLSLTTSNFDSYHTHHDTHLSPQTLAGIHSQQSPPAYAPTVAKRALLDYRKPIQPQPPPTNAEECYTMVSSRDHYNPQELLNTPETTTIFGEYEQHQNNATSLSSYSHTTEALADADKASDEVNKNLSLRDFIANWNDDEDEYQNNEELNFDQATVIDEVLQTAPVEQTSAALAVDDSEIIKTSLLDSKNSEHFLLKPLQIVENLDHQTLNDTDVNQYVNLPDIVIDIEKSNNINNSITTPSTSPTSTTQQEAKNTSLNLNNFDVEKELDELKLKKSTQQELTKDFNDIKDTKSCTTPQLSPCKNLTTQLSFEDLNLEPATKTVLNATTPTTRLTSNQSSELTENYFKEMEDYESGSSRHSNESAFEKEYETFINKITSDASVNKSSDEKSSEADKEMDFEQNVQDFSKFYKRKRKLKEDELKTSVPETQSQKKLKSNVATKVNNSNFPQVYTKKSRNKLHKAKQQSPHKRKPLSVYYKIIHSIRRFGLHRLKRVREYMQELKEKHLPLIKRQSIKNYTYGLPDNLFYAKSLKALCIMAINTEEFRERLMLSCTEYRDCCLETEEKHICTDPTCETCEVIKSLMEAESFEDTIMQQVCEHNIETSDISTAVLCEEDKNEIIMNYNAENISFHKEDDTMISNEIESVQYSKENLTGFDVKDLAIDSINLSDIKSLLNENSNFKTETEILVSQSQIDNNKSETEFYLNKWYEKSKSPEHDLQTKEYFEIPLEANCNVETSLTELKDNIEAEISNNDDFNESELKENACSKLDSQTKLREYENSNISTASKNIKDPETPTTAEFNKLSNRTLETENIATEKFSVPKYQESESEDSDSSESDSDSSSYSSDNESVDDSKDSHKKSENNDRSSDTDSETDLERDDEKLNSDSSQSYHSVNDNREFDLSKSENMELCSASKDNEMNDPVKEFENCNHADKELDVNTDSETEDEIIPKSPKHIVIRIKKSFKLSPNKNRSTEVYVTENSIKSFGKLDNQTESKFEDDDMSEKQCEVISTTLKLSPKLKHSSDDHVSETSESSESEFENQTESESEDDEISKKKIKLSPKQEDFGIQRLMDPHTQLDKHIESESEDDDISDKEYNIDSTLLKAKEKLMKPNTEFDNHTETESEDDENSKNTNKLSPKQEDFGTQQLMEPNTVLGKHIESESEDEDISKKESNIDSTLLKFSTKPEDLNTELDNHTNRVYEDEDTAEKESEMRLKREDFIESSATDKPIEPQTKFDYHTESDCEDEDILKKKSETILKSLKVSTQQEEFIDDHEFEKSIVQYTEMVIHTKNESEYGDISKNEMILLSTKKEDSVEDHTTENPIEPHTESDTHTESESDDDNILKKEREKIPTRFKLSLKNEDSLKDNVSRQSVESHTEFDSQSKSKDDIISEKKSEEITTSSKLTSKPEHSIDEKCTEPTESDYEDEEILDTNSEVNKISSKLSPKQNDKDSVNSLKPHTELDNQLEQESEDDNISEEETELFPTSLKFSPYQKDLIDQRTSLRSSKLNTKVESHTEHLTEYEALESDLKKETDILTRTSELSRKPQNSIDKRISEQSADLSNEAELFTPTNTFTPKLQGPKEVLDAEKSAEPNNDLDNHIKSESENRKSDFFELNQKPEDVKTYEFSKKCTQECTEVDDYFESHFEYDTDDELDLPLRLSNNEVQLKEADHKIILSDTDDSWDSESETYDENLLTKPIKKSNCSMPIMISDDESMANSFDSEDTQKSTIRSEKSLQEINSDAELTDSNDSDMSLIDGDNNDLLKNLQEKINNKNSNFLSNKLKLKEINDPKITEPAITTDKTMPTNGNISPDCKIMDNHVISKNVVKSSDSFFTNITIPKEDMLLDSAKINETLDVNNANSGDKCISEYSSSSEDSAAEVKLQITSATLSQDIKEQESINPEKNFSCFNCEENTDVALAFNIPDAKKNSPQMFECEANYDYTLERSSIYSPAKNELLQKSEELKEDSNTLEENSGIQKNFSEQTTQKQAALYETIPEEMSKNLDIFADDTVKNLTIDPVNKSNDFENEDQHKIKADSSSERSSILNANARVSEECSSQGYEDLADNVDREEAIAKTAKTEELNIQEDVNVPTAPDLDKSQTNSKAITKEPIIIESKESKADYMAEDFDSEKITDPLTEDCKNISETKNSETINNESIIESITKKSETPSDLSADINKEPLKEIYEFVTDKPSIIKKPATEESENLEKLTSEAISNKLCNQLDISDKITRKEREYIAQAINEESNNNPSLELLKNCDEISSEAATEVLGTISKEIPKNSDSLANTNNNALENSENTTEHYKNVDEQMVNEPDTISKSSEEKVIVWKKANSKPLKSLKQISNKKQVESPVEISQAITESSELGEESNTIEVFKEDCKQTNEPQDNLEDADVFKEVMQKDLGKNKETFDDKECNNTFLTKVHVTHVPELLNQKEDPTIKNKAIIQKAKSLEENTIKSIVISGTTCDQIESIIKGFENNSKEVTEKPNSLTEDEIKACEFIEKVSIPMNERLSETEVVAEEPKKPIEDKYETTECYEEDSDAAHACLTKFEQEEYTNKTSEGYEKEYDPFPKYTSKSEDVVDKPNSLIKDKIEISAKEEDSSLSKFKTVSAKPSSSITDDNDTFESFEEEAETHSKDDELESLKNQIDNKPLTEHQNSLKESLRENVLVIQKETENTPCLSKNNELLSAKCQADEQPSTEPESLTETVSKKGSNTQEDLSGDFLGFKNQSSFEDESEDFHGFEDLEEVTRIRQEIENLNDDSTANDGFLNYANLNRDLHKSSTTSLTGSTSSEINELEALEKELSQHQPEMEMEDEDEDKETGNELQTQTVKIVSTNDIEHIKKMLESDEEQQQDETDQGENEQRSQQKLADAAKTKDKFIENSKQISNDILSSVNSIIPKLSDLCRAALNSSLNSNSNLAQHTETPTTILVERELSVEEAFAEMYRQAGVLLSDPEDFDNDVISNGGTQEAHDVLLINLQEILNSDNNDVYVLQCDMNEHLLNVVQQTAEERKQDQQDNGVVDDTERVNTVQFIGILDTQSTEPQIHIISSDSESEVIILSDDESDFGYRPFIAPQERITIPFINDNDINDSDSLSDISTIHHEEIVPDNLNKFLQEEFYKYLHEKYVQRNISKYYHANRVLKKYRKRFVKTKRQ